MNTNKLYIGRLNRVTSVKKLSECDQTQINSIFFRYVLVKKNKYGYKDIIASHNYLDFNNNLQKDDVFIDNDYLIPFNVKYKNKKKHLTKGSIVKKIL